MSSLSNQDIGVSVQKEDGNSAGEIPCESPKTEPGIEAGVGEGPLGFPEAIF